MVQDLEAAPQPAGACSNPYVRAPLSGFTASGAPTPGCMRGGGSLFFALAFDFGFIPAPSLKDFRPLCRVLNDPLLAGEKIMRLVFAGLFYLAAKLC